MEKLEVGTELVRREDGQVGNSFARLQPNQKQNYKDPGNGMAGQKGWRIKGRKARRKPCKFVIQNDPAYKVRREVRIVR